MRTVRMFLEQSLDAGNELELGSDESHYLKNVLRLERGAALCLFNGDGREFDAEVIETGRRSMRIQVGEERLKATPGVALQISLGLGLSRGERMDWGIQKATELGVTSITPLLLERCNARVDDKRKDNRLRHWRQVIISACEQSGRCTLPTIEEPLPLDAWLADRPEQVRLVLDPHTDAPLRSLAEAPSSVALLVGPEGGLADEEVSQCLTAGFKRWQLGPRILRTETAPAAAMAILQYQWGDMRSAD